MGKLDDMRAAIRKGKDAPKPPPAPPVVPPPPPPPIPKTEEPKPKKEKKPRPPPKPPREFVTYRCGHTMGMKHFEHADCAECTRAALVAEPKDQKPKKMLPATPSFRNGRLPAGSVKHLEWDGAHWKGTLSVPECPLFEALTNTEMQCFRRLHRCYILWLEQQAEEQKKVAEAVPAPVQGAPDG